MTAVHESMHFLLHENDGRTPPGDKFIYATNGKGAFWPESALTTGEMAKTLPADLVAMAVLYKTYIQSRPTQPFGENVFDEWLAYITETYALIESTRAGTPTPNDSVEGASTEFLYYCASAMRLLAEKDPAHLEKGNVKAIFAMLAERAGWIIENLKSTPGLKYDRTVKFHDYLKSNAAAEPVRAALKRIYGATWTMRVLGF